MSSKASSKSVYNIILTQIIDILKWQQNNFYLIKLKY